MTPITKVFIVGASIVGGILILIMADEDEEENKTPDNKDPKTSQSKDSFNVDEIRRLRRELRHQNRLKKNATKVVPSKTT